MPTKRQTPKRTEVPIETVRHKDKRTNIPTEELRDFVAKEQESPFIVRYPRNPDLDPQLVWKGKDQQDSQPQEVPAVPIYIQEKIHPQAIIEDFRATSGKAAKKPRDAQLSLFSDFNGLPDDFDKRVDFYHHEGNWSNRLILGNSELVMTSLAEKEGLKGRVQMIYMDPPYGIKFPSNWQVSTRKRDVKDGKIEDMVRQPEQVQAFRDTWKLGIHSYLPYLRDRLAVARELLTESGSVFVQIGDENVHLVRCLMDEVFGRDNFVAQIAAAKTSGQSDTTLAQIADFVLWYARDKEGVKARKLFQSKDLGGEGASKYTLVELVDGTRSTVSRVTDNEGNLPAGARPYRLSDMTSTRPSQSGDVPRYVFRGRDFTPGKRTFRTDKRGLDRVAIGGRMEATSSTLSFVSYLDDFPVFQLTNIWTDIGGVQSRADPKVYVVQTAARLIERCLLMTTDPGDLVLDPTCGSGTTAYVAEQWGRRWITIDTSRVSLTLARTRLMAARFPYYLLSDTPEGIEKESELAGQLPPRSLPKTEADIRKGFVYKRVPHITLKAIANNEEIDNIHARWQETLEPLLANLNKRLKKKWQEWEVPREPEQDWPAEARKLLKEWWQARQDRQREIDASIARRADTEMLYDQPYEEKKRVRVTGPFTVESLSPHRTISVEEKKRRAEEGDPKLGLKIATYGPDQFGTMILDNLRTAGVQNTFKTERLRFDSLQAYAGQWIHGEGTYTDSDGTSKRVAVCIGPEHGTVGPQLVKEAAKEAVRGVGFDVLIVCGFAFDPHVSEEAKRYGNLTVLPTRMNPDLTMGDLLKKTGSGNLFMVFGEPDLEMTHQKDGRIVVELRGLDIFDPTTGEIRSSSTDDIACWFIDTDYNGESFFVRHAYFTGADEPYDKLKRALRAEIDEVAWSALYSTTSRPFDRPETGKLAVKVINHYGDEVLKVFDV
ncbi:MAG: site-specific DNA-methyltransferase [Candidatus Anammoximicrobium sp.]|nr:site-specific DNA-methyltransferase [Candidatus Anammoximicrobium sp.]